MKKLLIYFFLLGTLSACHIIYKSDIQQGNLLKQSAINQLKLGMTKEQVRYLLGSCVLRSPFQPNRRDYVYFYQSSYGSPIQQHIMLLFSAAGRLEKIKRY